MSGINLTFSSYKMNIVLGYFSIKSKSNHLFLLPFCFILSRMRGQTKWIWALQD
jgi:hypothetical protein